MRFYARTSSRTGVSLPFWLAVPVMALWLVVMLAVVVYGALAWLVLWGARSLAARRRGGPTERG